MRERNVPRPPGVISPVDTSKVAAMADTEPALAAESARADAFRTLADRHLDASYRLAHAILGQRAEAEDATHDAFVTAWRNWSTLRDRALFERWFDRILINTCRNRLRQRARWRSHDLSGELPVTTPDALGTLHERSVLWPALAQLAPDHRVVVALRFYRDLRVDEIAARLGVRPGTVKSRLHRALRELRGTLDHADPTRTLR
jgi:RNA polymerase sigma-70 factor (ECF subfamily)